VLSAGCGAVAHLSATAGDPVNGKKLFEEPTLPGGPGCGTCHTLADAGTQGKVGPDLDEAFKYDKKQGFDESTIRDVVRGQIAYSTTDLGTVDSNGNPNPGMPPNIVQGQEAKDIAEYVAKCSGFTKKDECGV
jgi:mono/diheme cytochrome c family protein